MKYNYVINKLSRTPIFNIEEAIRSKLESNLVYFNDKLDIAVNRVMSYNRGLIRCFNKLVKEV